MRDERDMDLPEEAPTTPFPQTEPIWDPKSGGLWEFRKSSSLIEAYHLRKSTWKSRNFL